jgi:hypothetical protein
MPPPKKPAARGKRPPGKKSPQGKKGTQRAKPAQTARTSQGNRTGKSAGPAEGSAAKPVSAAELPEADRPVEPTGQAADERTAKREAARQERIAAAKKKQKAKRRKRILIAAAVAVALAGGIAFAMQRSAADKAAAAQAAKAAGCGPVLTLKNQGREHLGPNATYNNYNSNPPTSGPHNPSPAPWGSYPDPVEKERLVHNLEHGGIVIYHKDLPDAQVDRLESFVDSYRDAVISVPDDSIDSPLVITSWTRMRKCERFSEKAVQGYIDEWCGKGPEKVTTCRR